VFGVCAWKDEQQLLYSVVGVSSMAIDRGRMDGSAAAGGANPI